MNFRTYPRDTQRYTHRTMAQTATQAVTDKALLQQCLHTGLAKIKVQTFKTPCSWAGRGWILLIQAYTSLDAQAPGIFVAPLSTYTAPLSGTPAFTPAPLLLVLLLYWSTLLLAAHTALALSSHRHPTTMDWILSPPGTCGSAWGSPACLLAQPEVFYLVPTDSSSSPGNIKSLGAPAANTQHMGCVLRTCYSWQHWDP